MPTLSQFTPCSILKKSNINGLSLSAIFNESVFWVLSMLFQVCWAAILAYMYASIAAEDRNGKIIILIPAVYALSSVIASAAAGFVYNYGHAVFLGYTASMVLISMMLWISLWKR